MNNLIHTELLKLSKEQKDRKTQKTKRAFWTNPRIWSKYFNKIILTDWLIFQMNSFELCWLSCTKLSYFQYIEWFGWHRQKQLSRGVLEKDVLKICSKFTGEHPYQSVISINCFATLLKWHFGMDVLLLICGILSEHLFLKTPLEGCIFIEWFSLCQNCRFALNDLDQVELFITLNDSLNNSCNVEWFMLIE